MPIIFSRVPGGAPNTFLRYQLPVSGNWEVSNSINYEVILASPVPHKKIFVFNGNPVMPYNERNVSAHSAQQHLVGLVWAYHMRIATHALFFTPGMIRIIPGVEVITGK